MYKFYSNVHVRVKIPVGWIITFLIICKMKSLQSFNFQISKELTRIYKDSNK